MRQYGAHLARTGEVHREEKLTVGADIGHTCRGGIFDKILHASSGCCTRGKHI